MQGHPIYINLFGTGLRFWQCAIPMDVYVEMEQIRCAHNTQWEQLLFDFDFLERFGYKHWSDMATQKEEVGFLLDPMNKIEIKQGQKIFSRFQAVELTGGETLFPLHTIHKEEITFLRQEGRKLFLLVHFEKGLIGKFKLDKNALDVQALTYQVRQINHLLFLSGIYYQNQQLISRRNDSVTTSSLVIWL